MTTCSGPAVPANLVAHAIRRGADGRKRLFADKDGHARTRKGLEVDIVVCARQVEDHHFSDLSHCIDNMRQVLDRDVGGGYELMGPGQDVEVFRDLVQHLLSEDGVHAAGVLEQVDDRVRGLDVQVRATRPS